MTYAHTTTIVTVDGIRPACRVAAGSPSMPGPTAVPIMIDNVIQCQAQITLSSTNSNQPNITDVTQKMSILLHVTVASIIVIVKISCQQDAVPDMIAVAWGSHLV